MFSETTATKKILALHQRIQVISGGTSASKTISILLKLIDMSQSDEQPKLTSITSETMPHLKRGAIRDFLNIMQSHGYYKEERWNRTDLIYTFETGSKIEFFSADQPGKVRGPRRDRLFINEGNNIPWEAADQMIIRTKELIIIDYNPVAEFWVHEEIIPHREHDFIILTYKDNEALDGEIVKEIESHKHNHNWWRVYGEGLLGEAEGRIYTGWLTDLENIPHEASLVRRGLDFGFSNDPTTIVDVYYYNGGYILDEVVYRKGMLNSEIAAYLKNLPQPNTLIMGDSAEPKSIAELQMYQLPIIGVQKKGFNSKSYLKGSIDYLQQQRISVTKRSVNLIKEYRNYLWMTDKEGHIINEPEPGRDHALDAVRYAFDGLRPSEDDDKPVYSGKLSSLWAGGSSDE